MAWISPAREVGSRFGHAETNLEEQIMEENHFHIYRS